MLEKYGEKLSRIFSHDVFSFLVVIYFQNNFSYTISSRSVLTEKTFAL